MPNWCNNELRINGDKADLEYFREFAKGNGIVWDGEDEITNAEGEKVRYDYELDFSKFIRPTKKELDKPYGSGEAYGYYWCINNWGTKWNACDICVYPSDDQTGDGEIEDELIYSFTTAWSPISQKLFDQMIEMFPKLDFVYRFYEEGCCFVGEAEMNGTIEGFTAPDSEEMRRVIEIYKQNACEEDKIGDEDDLLCDIYCDFFDAWACDENLYFAGGHFYWKPFGDEEIVLKEGTH
jgi:hypothetical protein